MCYYGYGIDEYLYALCDCESYRICEWHTKLRQGVSLQDLAEDMEQAYEEKMAARIERYPESETEVE